jgi:decaprenyl-phosphate phosphoribosyltransferase
MGVVGQDQADLVASGAAPPSGWRSSLAGGLVRTARPKQWLKNVLVFAAPGAAGVLTHRHALIDSVAAFGIFCLVAGGAYFVNDALDVEADRRHPRKRLRPIASGVIGVRQAQAIGTGLVAVGLALSVLVAVKFTLVLAIYVAVQVAYSLWLKDEAVVDLAAVASGFVLRAISGGVAAHVPISNWFLIVASFGSLFIVAGKRHAEHVDLRDGRGAHRSTLETYSLAYLGYVRAVSSGVAMTAYCLWAFEKAKVAHDPVLFQLSIIPFVLAVLRYALLLDAGQGGAPEEIVIGDRALQVLGLVWVGLFAAGVYAA